MVYMRNGNGMRTIKQRRVNPGKHTAKILLGGATLAGVVVVGCVLYFARQAPKIDKLRAQISVMKKIAKPKCKTEAIKCIDNKKLSSQKCLEQKENCEESVNKPVQGTLLGNKVAKERDMTSNGTAAVLTLIASGFATFILGFMGFVRRSNDRKAELANETRT